jgi:hypothetical protein
MSVWTMAHPSPTWRLASAVRSAASGYPGDLDGGDHVLNTPLRSKLAVAAPSEDLSYGLKHGRVWILK